MDSLVSSDWLADHLRDPDLLVVDTRWYVDDDDSGKQAYLADHLPGAVFIDLDRELSDRSDLSRGRHPLPDPNHFAKVLGEAGIGPETRVVAYDDAGGSIAARLWWMMAWIGLPHAAVLDGGIPAWKAGGRPTEKGEVARTAHAEPIVPKPNWAIQTEIHEVEQARSYGMILIDARRPERFRGEEEPIDARPGHLPGAVNVPWRSNLTENEPQVMRPLEELRRLYEGVAVGGITDTACYCGSGVTACLNVLAMKLAGFKNIRLYPGSWSEWVAKYPEP